MTNDITSPSHYTLMDENYESIFEDSLDEYSERQIERLSENIYNFIKRVN